MEQPYWQKQSDKPLFPELEWSRPENKNQAGKLLVIGGTEQGFAAPAEAYSLAVKAGIGSVSVLLPGSLRKTVGKIFPEAEFAPSTPSGSFGASAFAEFCDRSAWADAVLFPGDIGRNSETTALLENFLEHNTGQVTLSGDAAELFCIQPHALLQRPNTLLVLTVSQLQHLGSNARFARAFTSNMGVSPLAEALHEFTKRFTPYFMITYENTLVVAVNGQISSTLRNPTPTPLALAASATTWWLQNPTKPFEALTMCSY
jgi:NAD(P)H-hydrate repair Nnr-like enzyme with NAD(P)H-hydrate dehydratase domain